MSFFNMDATELESFEPIWFAAKVPVTMTILSVKEVPNYGNLVLTCKIEDGEHEGKQYELTISGNDAPMARKKKAEFLLAFWSKAQIIAGEATIDTLIGTRFQCRPAAPFEGKNGKTYQNCEGFLKLAANPTENVPF